MNSAMLKGYYKGKNSSYKNEIKGRYKKIQEMNQLFERLMMNKKNKDVIRVYKNHKDLFAKFFFQMSSGIFQDLYEHSTIEYFDFLFMKQSRKIIDHFVIWGESTLYGVGIFLIEQIILMEPDLSKDTDISDMISLAKLVEDVVVIQKLLYLGEFRNEYNTVLSNIKS